MHPLHRGPRLPAGRLLRSPPCRSRDVIRTAPHQAHRSAEGPADLSDGRSCSNAGRRRRDYDKPTLLAEDSNPDAQARYTVTAEQCFPLPREFITNLWIFALTDTELACYLALRWAQQQAPVADRASFFILSQDRQTKLRLTRTTWDSIERLQAYGLSRRTDFSGRDPVTGTIESFRDKWNAGEVTSARYAFTMGGVQRPALPAVRHALHNPVAPVRPDPLDSLFETAVSQAET